MKNTPERLKAMDNIVMAVKYFNEHISETGYQIERHISADNEYIYLRIKTPRDDKYAAYPEVYINDDWYGTGMVSFGIATTGYGDHSFGQAQRALHGLECAIELVKVMTATAEASGLTVHR